MAKASAARQPTETATTVKKDQFLADRVHNLYDHAVLASIATLVNGCILALVLRGQVNSTNLMVWLVCVLVVVIIRLSIIISYHRAEPANQDAGKWKTRFFIPLFFSGMLWAAPAIFLFPSSAIGHQVFIAFVIGGMVAGAVGSFPSILTAYYIFSIPAMLPLVIRFFLVGGEIHTGMGFMLLLYFLIMSLTVLRAHRNYLQLLALRYEKLDLVEELQQEIAQRRQAEKELRQKNRQIETIVATRTAELNKAVSQLSDEVTARKKAAHAREQVEEQLQFLNEELERRVERRTRELQETQSQYLHAEKLSAIGKLSASIAHEFNNPLQGIITILQGFTKTKNLEEEDRDLLGLAISESHRMKSLIHSLQDFNRPSSGKKVLMNVHASIDSLLLLCKSDFKRKKIAVVLNYAERLPQILAIPDQIKQVFFNLLNNAADACAQKENGGLITITTRREEQRVAVTIEDNGTGMKPEQFNMIFQPFYTTKPEVKGTGLGLSVCHGIVQYHRGEIRVVSQPGEGSTFTVLLPINSEVETP